MAEARHAPKPGRCVGRTWRLLRAQRLNCGTSAADAGRAESTATTTATSSGVGEAGDDAEQRFLLLGHVAPYSGMFPCFFGGRLARLLRRARSARMTIMRVSCGKITRSM